VARNIVTWDPFREISTMRDDMERLFDTMIGRYPRERTEGFWAPSVDVEETNDTVNIRAEVPGMNKEDIKVTVSEDTVTLSGERKQEAEQKDRTFHRIERVYGKFQRTIALPASVEGDQAKASYKAGVLELVLPKSPKTRAHEIQIKAED
jgi:HSP20 family protein